MDNKLEADMLIKAGRAVVLASHQHFMDAHLDNAEYIPAVRASIEGLGRLADDLIHKEFGQNLRRVLSDYTRELFVQTWLQLASEDEDADPPKIETMKALKTFNEIFAER